MKEEYHTWNRTCGDILERRKRKKNMILQIFILFQENMCFRFSQQMAHDRGLLDPNGRIRASLFLMGAWQPQQAPRSALALLEAI